MHFKETQESIAECTSVSPLTLLVVGLKTSLERAAFIGLRIIEAENGEEAHQCLTTENVDLLILGSRLKPKVALQILDRYTANRPGNSTLAVILCADSQHDLFQSHVSEGRIFYLARTELAPQQLRSMIIRAEARLRSTLDKTSDTLAATVAESGELLEFCIRLSMQVDLRGAAGVLIVTARDLLNAETVRYLAYDAVDETLTPIEAGENEQPSESAAAGLVAFVARTGEGICLDRIDTDARYDVEADNPVGLAGARFLAEPLIGYKSVPVGVLAATRCNESVPFSQEDVLLLRHLIECAAPTFNQIILQSRVQALLLKHAEGAGSDVFREEALEHHIRCWDHQGEVLKNLPSWLRATYWGMFLLVLLSLLATVLVRVNIYASGPAVIRARNSLLQNTEYDVIAFLPESDISNIRPGMSIRLRTEGAPTFGAPLRINYVGHEVMDPIAVAQYAGKVDDLTFRVADRVIAVRATLPPGHAGTFVYRDSVTGEAEVSVRSEAIIFVLIPSLRKIFGQVD
jgi:GAF domain-containing protein